MKLNSFPHYLQLDAMDCGPSCLRMIAKYYGKSYSCKLSVHALLLPVKEFPCWASAMRRNRSVSVLRGAHLFGATEEGCTVALHSALEPESLRGLL